MINFFFWSHFKLAFDYMIPICQNEITCVALVFFTHDNFYPTYACRNFILTGWDTSFKLLDGHFARMKASHVIVSTRPSRMEK